MSTNLADLLQRKFINSWNLFWLITLPISTLMVFSMIGVQEIHGANTCPVPSRAFE